MVAESFILRAKKVLTMNSNDEANVEQAVWIDKGKIQAVDHWSALASKRDLPIIDMSAYTLMPGLIDAHTHVVYSGNPNEDWRFAGLAESAASTALKAAKNAYCQLEMGVTTLRDLGARDGVDLALRNAIAEGWQQGPRMLVAGKGITTTGGHMDTRKFLRPDMPIDLGGLGSIGIIANTPYEARTAAWEQIMHGADLVKLNATLSEYVRASGGECSPELDYESMYEICQLAHNTSRKVAAHCHGGKGVDAALKAGVDTFEHGRFLTDEQLEQMAKQEAFLVPTLSPEARRIEEKDPPKAPAIRQWYEKASSVMYKTVARARQHGVNIVAGSDAGMPYVYHGSLAFEIKQLAQAGLSNMQALAAATRVAAAALGLGNHLGQIQTGFEADLILINGDPSQDLTILEKRDALVAIMQQGRFSKEVKEQI